MSEKPIHSKRYKAEAYIPKELLEEGSDFRIFLDSKRNTITFASQYEIRISSNDMKNYYFSENTIKCECLYGHRIYVCVSKIRNKLPIDVVYSVDFNNDGDYKITELPQSKNKTEKDIKSYICTTKIK